jgi:hypothetical protein
MDTRIVVGCNYHTKWQRNKSMRFVLAEVKGDKVWLQTRNTDKSFFWTNFSDLIFIERDYNKKKADILSAPQSNVPVWVNGV